jgi:ubiquinone/menaquinone biosynthesis C-methylase UbiE
MSIWGHIFAALYDRMVGKTERAGLGDHRRALLAAANGDVLEIGGGTGANLEYYGDGVRTLTIVEPEKPMLRRLQRHIEERAPQAKVLRAPAEDLPFNDASFDVAVSTLVLCTVDDVPRALRELHRVLRPGGKLLFIEHVRSDDPALARTQDRMLPINVRIAHGCHPNRRSLDSIRDAGFEVSTLEHDTLKHAPKFIQPLIVGVATRGSRQAETAAAGTSETSSERLETPTFS